MNRTAIDNVHYLKGIRWVKPGCIRGLLSSWNRYGNVTEEEERWKIPNMHLEVNLEREKQ